MGKYSDQYNDNGQHDQNMKNNSSSVGRTSKTSELCNTTSKCQYERLSNTTPNVGTHSYSSKE